MFGKYRAISAFALHR